MIEMKEIYWAAGFLEGDGTLTKNGTTIGLAATQKTRWPLDRLQASFGGAVSRYKHSQNHYYWRWTIYGSKAAGLMMTFYSEFSPRRQQRARELLLWWSEKGLRGSHNRSKTHCKRGHPLSGGNLRTKPDGGRECKTCQEASRQRYLKRKREKELAALPA